MAKYVLTNNIRYGATTLYAGKVIDDQQYDINKVLGAGAQLVPADPVTGALAARMTTLKGSGSFTGQDAGTPLGFAGDAVGAAAFYDQADYYFHATAGSDSGAGTEDSPIATLAELGRRLGSFARPLRAAITLHLLSPMSADDPLDLSLLRVAGGAGSVTVVSAGATARITGTLGSVVPPDPDAALGGAPVGGSPWQMTEAAKSWTAQVGYRVRITATPRDVAAMADFNVTLDSGLPQVDGYQTRANDVVLLTAQDDPVENGPWVVHAAGAWTRPTTYSVGGHFKRHFLYVNGGGVYAGQACLALLPWDAGDPTADVIGTDPSMWMTNFLAKKGEPFSGPSATVIADKGSGVAWTGEWAMDNGHAEDDMGVFYASPTAGDSYAVEEAYDFAMGNVRVDGKVASGSLLFLQNTQVKQITGGSRCDLSGLRVLARQVRFKATLTGTDASLTAFMCTVDHASSFPASGSTFEWNHSTALSGDMEPFAGGKQKMNAGMTLVACFCAPFSGGSIEGSSADDMHAYYTFAAFASPQFGPSFGFPALGVSKGTLEMDGKIFGFSNTAASFLSVGIWPGTVAKLGSDKPNGKGKFDCDVSEFDGDTNAIARAWDVTKGAPTEPAAATSRVLTWNALYGTVAGGGFGGHAINAERQIHLYADV